MPEHAWLQIVEPAADAVFVVDAGTIYFDFDFDVDLYGLASLQALQRNHHKLGIVHLKMVWVR